MKIREVFSVLGDVPLLLKVKKGLAPRPTSERDCFAKFVEANASRIPNRNAITFEGSTISWSDLNAQANKYANALKAHGLAHGDVVSLMMENRVEFLTMVVAMNKIGVTAALINTALTGRQLQHCIDVTKSKLCVFGSERNDAIAGVRDEVALDTTSGFHCVPESDGAASPEWAHDLTAAASNQLDSNLVDIEENTLGDTAFYIFTSGTTGLPKAAVLSNRRFNSAANLSHIGGLRCSENDTIYICLPLYHGTGLTTGVGAAFSSGATIFLRRRFSASQFLTEVRDHNVTGLIYVGELCRYLMNTPAQPGDAENSLHTALGNGLRPDIWKSFKKRFGINRITEFYSASESNVAFFNLFNKDETIGTTTAEVALVTYDVDNDAIVRDEHGRCVPVGEGEPGLCIGQINASAVLEGYSDADETEKKILRDVFEKGDAWFNTGDLIKTVDVGFALGLTHYQFVDRLGDTFRWRSENVSTNEVGEIINRFEGVDICNVYGVEIPNTEGRAGMAAIATTQSAEEFDIAAFSSYVNESLPPFARPVFLRLQGELQVTGTFKMVKGDLRSDGYNIDACEDPIYIMKPGEDTYSRLDQEMYQALETGQTRF